MSIQSAIVQVSGNIGTIEERQVSEGLTVTRLSVAVNTRFRGEDITNWYSVQFWNGSAHDLVRRCDGDLQSLKGSFIVLTGKFLSRPYVSSAGQEKVELLLENPAIVSLSLKKAEDTQEVNKEAPKKAAKSKKAAE